MNGTEKSRYREPIVARTKEPEVPTPVKRRRPGYVRPDELLEQREAMGRLRWGRVAWRKAVVQGMTVHRCFGKTFVLGADLIRFITSGSP